MRRVSNPPENVREDYERFCDFIEEKVTFNMQVSEWHTREHESRVLLFALLIADKIGVSDQEKEILGLAASFHDTRREDDWYDVGHGRRAAEYYKDYCAKSDLIFYPWCYNIMAYHDLDDKFGERAMVCDHTGREVLLYHIFKDADALDRFRLGPNGLDVKFLRTDAAKELYDYAKELWHTQFAKEGDENVSV